MPTYRLGDEIGRGALGRVVRVLDEDTGRAYAGKILHDSFRDDPRAAERFAREARLLEGIEDPQLVRVYGLAEIEGCSVILMELVEGPSLQTLLAREGPLPQPRLQRIARGIAAGLQAAHHRGLVHRDLKPGNVLVAPGDRPKLVDFGLARASSMLGVDRTSLTLVGTPDYMAPEALDPLAVDARSDLYALGCVLFEMTTGAPPFSGASAFGILDAHRRTPPPALAPTADRSPALIALIGALLAKSPADRPQSAEAVVAALDGLATPEASTALVPVAAPSARASACTSCGAPLVEGVFACFGCGRQLATVGRGQHTIFVLGPGQVAERLDAGLRSQLVDWLLGNPALGLDPEPLLKKSPRLPFRLLGGVDAESAEGLARSLRSLGLQVEVRRGGALALPQMRHKVRKMMGRAAAVAGGSLAGLTHTIGRAGGFVLLGSMAALLIASGVGGWVLATRPVTRPRLPPRPLDLDLQRALDQVSRALPAMTVGRHRESLRGVLTRVLALDSGSLQQRSLAGELAPIVAAATQACLRLDQLDDELGRSDLREPTAEDRQRLQERDRLATRLLEMTARLEAARARLALAGARRGRPESLDDLRAQVEALEEMSRS